MAETITVRGEGITVDLLLWRKYGVRSRSVVEATFALNPGLAALGPILPLGTLVTLADLPAAATKVDERLAISLFD
ncbi:MAG TPA: tail protein X [Shinella sp.]|jgi:phage tail protein X|uniref:tail protein X n=1 Tax=Shinella sp. TaxID=1870904 RepID=UPI002E0D2C30|nr:tail protein X [Shinella sp.]